MSDSFRTKNKYKSSERRRPLKQYKKQFTVKKQYRTQTRTYGRTTFGSTYTNICELDVSIKKKKSVKNFTIHHLNAINKFVHENKKVFDVA